MLVSVGFRQAFVEYHAAPRNSGQSGYTWRRMTAFALHAIVGYSELPLYWSFGIGLLAGAGASIYGIYVAFIRLFTDQAVPGWASLAVLLSFFMALQFGFIGLLGTYVAAVYREVKRRPPYVIAGEYPERER
jgi:dolichol-phosphate mannosyltransferase